MKKICLQIIGLIASLMIFCVSLLLSASNFPVANADIEQNNFFENSDMGVGQLFDSEILSEFSNVSSNIISSNSSQNNFLSTDNSSKSNNSIINSKPPENPESLFPSVLPSGSEIVVPPPPSSSETSSSSVPPPPPNEAFINILAGAVQAEIIGTNSVPLPKRYEAYKAQAVATHTYMEYYKKNNGSYPSIAYVTPHPQTIKIVTEVENKLIYYNNALINASYHAYSGGHTQSSEYVWGGVVPYLRGVPSKYDDYIKTYTISTAQTSSLLKIRLNINTSPEPSSWFSLEDATKTDGGFIDKIKVCGIVTTARKLRENVFGGSNLKSTKITNISVTGENFIFTTNGYGHGVGMSQGGAIGYAENEGYTYEQILKKYYTGVTVK